ncbi:MULTISPECIES: TetR/AcrR family transcriptional regulator [Bizionia]|uniref:TetR/AcrR family transcriptional regulator n=1 Tax=Bizionia algoritergicola TaxID=291187 RepID=A0A5D0R3L1_9FLAO|nr:MULTISPECIES: TetR/AcrR family transcriptional regulator [Bizionia]OBX23704.1 TetR family transcriptional regulator [Bizionia sp. APA-3]TYB75426.1 TetR/AcrR family transcriptional regulator [Bizionia algoritergicola]
MKDKILKSSADLFLNYGFKSVTMDDIANEIGVSKKTIYLHYATKTKLVQATTLYMFEFISHGIDCICALNQNPIDEIFEIKKFTMTHLKDEKSSPQYQLKKYYPKIFESLKNDQFHIMQDCVKNNLIRGVSEGLYRNSIDVEFVSRLYFNTMMSLKDVDIFPTNDFPMKQLMDNYLEYHIRGISTKKGIDKLDSILSDSSKIKID